MKSVEAIGYLAADCKMSQNGERLYFTVIESEKFKDAEGVEREIKTTFSCNVKNGSISKYLMKGTKVFIKCDTYNVIAKTVRENDNDDENSYVYHNLFNPRVILL